MTYNSKVTSKGTVTLPARFRDKLGIIPGKEVSIELLGDTILIKSQGGWEELMVAGAKVRADLKRRGISMPGNPEELKKLVDEVKIKDYKKKYLGKS